MQGSTRRYCHGPHLSPFDRSRDWSPEALPQLGCLGCGWCCLDNPCEVSQQLHGFVPRCPELFFDPAQARYVCLLVREALAGRPRPGADLTPLFVGQGCCHRESPWRGAVKNRG